MYKLSSKMCENCTKTYQKMYKMYKNQAKRFVLYIVVRDVYMENGIGFYPMPSPNHGGPGYINQ